MHAWKCSTRRQSLAFFPSPYGIVPTWEHDVSIPSPGIGRLIDNDLILAGEGRWTVVDRFFIFNWQCEEVVRGGG